METLNVIFENYGGERLVRVFKTYWILSLLIKQLIFSFFMLPADQVGHSCRAGNNLDPKGRAGE